MVHGNDNGGEPSPAHYFKMSIVEADKECR